MGKIRRAWSLRKRFLLPTVLLITVGMSILGTVSYTRSKQALEKVMTDQLLHQTETTVQFIEQWLQNLKVEAVTLAEQELHRLAMQDSPIGQAARETAIEQLIKVEKNYKIFESINIATTTGEIVVSSDRAIIGKVNVNDRTYFQEAFKRDVYISDTLVSRVTGNPVFMLSSPIKETDRVVGVFFGAIDLSRFNEQLIYSIRIGQSGYAFIFKKDGTVIAHPDKSLIFKEKVHLHDFGKAMMAEDRGMISYVWQGEEKIASFRKIPDLDWKVVITAYGEEFIAPVRELRFFSLILTSVIALFALVFVLWTVRSTVRPINRIAQGLRASSDEVTSASSHVASAAQHLAEGAFNQAAATEEAMSALEEMGTMTKQNADNAGQVYRLMKQARQVVEQANGSMAELKDSMHLISVSSEETSKIIKTIDEIAFQTNLLSLNAAVEAARAGEAGAGFAVVAEEVRNLAVRAAEAAGNTTELLEDTLKKIRNGVALVSTTHEAFTKVTQSTRKVGELIDEIAAASEEQARGIEQVNKGMMQIDEITRENAANAEESASSAEEMHAQAEHMREFVEELLRLISGGKESTPSAPATEGQVVTIRPISGPSSHPGEGKSNGDEGRGGFGEEERKGASEKMPERSDEPLQ